MRPMPKIERTSSLPSTPRAQAVTRTATPAAGVTSPKAPVTTYAGPPAPTSERNNPRGAQVSRSADPSALWGEPPKANELDPATFTMLSPTEQHAALVSLRQERQQLNAEIQARLQKLDVKWNNSRLVTRTEALREYQENTQHLDPAAKQELDGLLARSEASQQKINGLRAKIDRLPKSPEAKKAQAALRTQLAHELLRARAEQSKMVKAATAVADDQGLKSDRLAVTEQIIDPAAPKPGSGQSLLEKVARFFHLDVFLTWVGRNLLDLFIEPEEDKREKRRAESLDHDRKRVDERLRAQRMEEARIDDQSVERTRQSLAFLTARTTASAR